ncbi:hypothetical protein [Roseivirga thermotolerans]|uniref:Uncharacterized protein n=1 Tax=Roseivirga thermotolerans TaxID=1758176 RepID=A0ABQ3I7P3_9BACT|nr:hypothetical protein [Roseivirga thermotolerans]GHE65005.1 hypothetical protein GCM10011340_20030 [Roseivirga thermotolerans]
MNIEKVNVGEEVFYAGSFFEVAEIKDFPHGKMIGIYDEPGTGHIDYLNPGSVSEVVPCHNCQNGCTTCNGFGKLVH